MVDFTVVQDLIKWFFELVIELFKTMFPIGIFIDYFKRIFSWIFDPINAIFSSGYNFFISGCYLCIIIQVLGMFVELFSIARIIAG